MNEPIAEDLRFMEFRLGKQLFALPLLTVKEVIPKPEITNLPNMPSHFEGMINLRGQILGVYNIFKKLNSTKDQNEKKNEVVIVIENQENSVGMVVDEVTRVLNPEKSLINSAPLKEDDPARNYVTSIIRDTNELVMVINVYKLLELDKYKTDKQRVLK